MTELLIARPNPTALKYPRCGLVATTVTEGRNTTTTPLLDSINVEYNRNCYFKFHLLFAYSIHILYEDVWCAT